MAAPRTHLASCALLGTLVARRALRAPTVHPYQLAVTGTAWAWAPPTALAATLWAIRTRSRLAALTAGTSWALTASVLAAPTRQLPGSGDPVRIASANLLNRNRSPHAAAHAAADLPADVLVAVEVDDVTADVLAKRLGPPVATGRNGSSRVHIHTSLHAWPLAPVSVGAWSMPCITLESGLRVVGVHTVNPSATSALGTWRDQLAALGEVAGPVVLAGDFNTSVAHPEWDLVRGVDAATAAGRRWVPTWGPHPAGPRLLGLDHVAARGAHLSDFSRHRIPGSDHDAVAAVACITHPPR